MPQNTLMKNSIAEKIRFLRKSKNYSQEEMAEKLCISQSAYARMERGESNSWANHIVKLSEIFEIKPEEFFVFNPNNKISYNNLSEKLIEQYEARIKVLEEQLEYWKNKY